MLDFNDKNKIIYLKYGNFSLSDLFNLLINEQQFI